jgi:hypothetical protein
MVLTWVGSLPSGATQAPLNHFSVPGSAPSAIPAEQLGLVADLRRGAGDGGRASRRGARVEAVADAEAIGVGGHDLDVQRRDAELVGHQPGVVGLAPVGLGGEAQHHLAGRVDAQEDCSVGLAGHHRLSLSSLAAAVAARRRRS